MMCELRNFHQFDVNVASEIEVSTNGLLQMFNRLPTRLYLYVLALHQPAETLR
jgi:hypothetical protein